MSGPARPAGFPAGSRFAFVTPCGWGNLGDAAIVDSLLHGLRRRVPGAEAIGFTLNPADTARRHGVEAHRITSFAMPYYPLGDEPTGEPDCPAGPEDAAEPRANGAAGPAAGMRARLATAKAALRTLPVPAGARSLLLAAARLGREPRALAAERRRLAGTAAVVVAGGGQLDALFGGLFGQPYILWRWSWLARRLGAPYYVLSVGTGTVNAASRWLFARALRHAAYRSYRDHRSGEMLRAPGLTSGDPVVPDLAYGLDHTAVPPPAGATVVVGVSPMNHQHPDFYPHGRLDKYEAHLRAMEAVCVHLLAVGCEVVVFITDSSDDGAQRDLVARLDRLAPHDRARVRLAGADTVPSLMATYDGVDAVVASRLHGALLAHVAHRPVFALGHERKVRALLTDAGHERFYSDTDAFDAAGLSARLDAFLAARAELAVELVGIAATRRAAVEAQYDALFGRPTA